MRQDPGVWEEGVVLSSRAVRPVPQHPISTCPSRREEFSTAEVLRDSQGAWPSSWGLKARGKLLGQGRHYAGSRPKPLYALLPSVFTSPCKGGHSFCLPMCTPRHTESKQLRCHHTASKQVVEPGPFPVGCCTLQQGLPYSERPRVLLHPQWGW